MKVSLNEVIGDKLSEKSKSNDYKLLSCIGGIIMPYPIMVEVIIPNKSPKFWEVDIYY